MFCKHSLKLHIFHTGSTTGPIAARTVSSTAGYKKVQKYKSNMETFPDCRARLMDLQSFSLHAHKKGLGFYHARSVSLLDFFLTFPVYAPIPRSKLYFINPPFNLPAMLRGLLALFCCRLSSLLLRQLSKTLSVSAGAGRGNSFPHVQQEMGSNFPPCCAWKSSSFFHLNRKSRKPCFPEEKKTSGG